MPSDPKLIVFAAASLTDPFEALRGRFQERYPPVDVRLHLAAAPHLRERIEAGEPCDVYASADRENVARLEEKGLVLASAPLAENKLCVILPKANRAGIERLPDLARPGIRVLTEPESLPMGRYMRQILANLSRAPGYGPDYGERVLGNVGSQAVNVKHIVVRVSSEEADAGFVYVSDVTPDVRGSLRVIAVPEESNVTAHYMIAVMRTAALREWAAAFMDMAVSPAGRGLLESFGFAAPGADI